MDLTISKDSKVYIAAHANFATGGLEALHQLGSNIINEFGIQAFMYYLPLNHPDPVHKEYKSYNVPIASEIEDSEKNILIVPEVTFGINALKNYKNIKKAVWWLSVDNFYASQMELAKDFAILTDRIVKNSPTLLSGLSHIAMNQFDNSSNLLQIFTGGASSFLTDAINGVGVHLTQSRYAFQHLKDRGINNLEYLTDYLNEEFLKIETELTEKEDIVAYNPNGSDFTKKIIEYDKDIKFVPIVNMSRQEVIKTFQRAKVHINFRNFSAKDRITREAAFLGCCIITCRKGGAKYYEDIPIPDEYKFDDIEGNIPAIAGKIKECFENFDEEYKKFEIYRNIVKNEKETCLKALKKILLFDKQNG